MVRTALKGDPPHPPQFGRYRVLCHLADGGMGTIYLAKDPNLHRVVAIKVIHAEALARSPAHRKVLLERFRKEAEVLAALRNPSIVEVFDFDDEGGVPYLVMEFVDGQTLEGVFRQLHGRWFDPVVTACLLVQAADGLCAAAKLGVVHRDLKPENLLIHQEGILKIADFGISHWVDHSTTRTGIVLGSQFYMSPEQAEGKKLTVQSDLFALGTVAYRCLVGEVPFPGESQLTVARKIVHEPHTPILSRRPDLDPALGRVVETLLQKDPARRGAGPRWLRDTLRTYLHSLGIVDPQERIRTYVLDLESQGIQTTGSFDRDKIRRIEHQLHATERPRGTVREARPKKESRFLVPLFLFVLALTFTAGGIWYYAHSSSVPAVKQDSHPTSPPAPRPALADRPPQALVEAINKDTAAALPPARPHPRTRMSLTKPPRLEKTPVPTAAPSPAEEALGETILSVVSSPPFAEVTVDGLYLGNAPIRDRKVRAGTHRIRLEWKNAENGSLDTMISIPAGEKSLRFYLPGFKDGD